MKILFTILLSILFTLSKSSYLTLPASQKPQNFLLQEYHTGVRLEQQKINLPIQNLKQKTELSFSFWVKTYSATPQSFLRFYDSQGQFFSLSDEGITINSAPIILLDNNIHVNDVWTHIVLSFNLQENTLLIYQFGEHKNPSETQIPFTSSLDQQELFLDDLQKIELGPVIQDQYAEFDEFKVYSTALTQSQVDYIYHTSIRQIQDLNLLGINFLWEDILSYYNFQNSSINDTINNNKPLYEYHQNGTSTQFAEDRNSNPNSAAKLLPDHFLTYDHQLPLQQSSTQTPKQYTITFRAKWNTQPQNDISAIQVYLKENNQQQSDIYYFPSLNSSAYSLISTQKWQTYSIIASIDSGKVFLTLFIDGVEAESQTHQIQNYPLNIFALNFGGRYMNQTYEILLDDLIIHEKELSLWQIAQISQLQQDIYPFANNNNRLLKEDYQQEQQQQKFLYQQDLVKLSLISIVTILLIASALILLKKQLTKQTNKLQEQIKHQPLYEL